MHSLLVHCSPGSEPLLENSPLTAEMVVNSASSVKLKSHSYTSGEWAGHVW